MWGGKSILKFLCNLRKFMKYLYSVDFKGKGEVDFIILTGYKAIYVCVFSTRVWASSIVSILSQRELEKTTIVVYGQRSKLA